MDQPAALARSGRGTTIPHANSAFWPMAAIMLLLALQFSMVFTRAVNWDEFHYYALVARFAAEGDLPTALQTLHVRLFAWVPGMASNSVDGIVLARQAMFACELVTLACIYGIARRFADRPIALLAVLAYLSTGYVLQHSFAFRTDPQATAALMLALFLLARAPFADAKGWLAAVAIGGLIGLAGMISIKAVLYAPAFAGLAWMRWRGGDGGLTLAFRIAAIPLVAALAFTIVYHWHAAGVAQISAPLAGDAATIPAGDTSWQILAAALDRMFFLGLPNQRSMMIKAVFLAPVMTALTFAAPIALARHRAWSTPETVALVGLWAPLLTLGFYENTASYYYAFMLAPVAVSTVAALRWAGQKLPPIVLTAAMFSMCLGVFVMENRSVIDRQRTVVELAGQLVPAGNGYFDHADMVPVLSKRNGFMTPWGMQVYRDAGQPIYRHAMEQAPVPLMIANWWVFGDLDNETPELFLPRDAAALKENYVPIAPPIFLAGRDVPGDSALMQTDFLVPGPYTAYGAPLELDGKVVKPGETVQIERGQHRLAPIGGKDARLIWGTGHDLPGRDSVAGPTWVAL